MALSAKHMKIYNDLEKRLMAEVPFPEDKGSSCPPNILDLVGNGNGPAFMTQQAETEREGQKIATEEEVGGVEIKRVTKLLDALKK